jgi:hypothetical protein
MEGSLPKNNSKAASKNLGVEGTEKKIINKKPLIREKQENKPKKRGLYEIRTMKHDLDRAKGKNVSTLSLTEESLSAVNKESKIKEIRSGGIKSIDALTLEDSFKEGSIDFDAKKKRSFKKPSLISLKNISGKKTILKLAVALIIIIFIGGAGFYFYKSGALPSFGGIKEIFNDLFNRTTPDDEAPIIPPATSTPDIPIQPEPTSTPPIVDDSKSKYFPAFFNPDEEEIIKVDMLEEIYPKLKASFENGLKEESFKRIIVLAHNDFSSIGLAQVWKTLKTLVLGEKYTELISAEITESWGLAMPRDVDRKLSEIYNLFFYGQPENGPRAVLIFKIDDITGLKDEMFLWEETMIYDLKKLFLGADYEEAASADYLDNIYKDINIRYLNLPEHDLTIDYAIIPDKNYLILSTSRESIWATIDKILGAGPVAVDDEKEINISDWNIYENKKHGFTAKYPSVWKIDIDMGNEDGTTFYDPDNDNNIIMIGAERLNSQEQAIEELEKMVSQYQVQYGEGEVEEIQVLNRYKGYKEKYIWQELGTEMIMVTYVINESVYITNCTFSLDSDILTGISGEDLCFAIVKNITTSN